MRSNRCERCVAGFCLLILCGCGPSGGIRITPVPVDRSLEMTMLERESPWISEKVAILDIDGVIQNAAEGGFLTDGENPMTLMIEKIDAIRRDPSIRAVVLRINSPGGTVTASDILYQELMRLKHETKKPIVAMLMDVAASGGYYVACAADAIIAQRTTVTGSIGVIMQTVSFSGTMAKLGIKADAITSGPMKDAGSPLRDMKPEERKVFAEIVNKLYENFLDAVRAGRPKIDPGKYASIADGRVYTAAQAVENGLIDRIGTLRDAIATAKERAGLKRANVVAFRRPLGWKPNVYSAAPGVGRGGLTVNFLNVSAENIWTNTPRFLYLWTLE